MNNARASRVVEMFEQRGEDFHALVCRTPQNVVMLTGYQPILGNSFCVVTVNKAREVEIRLAVPEDEEEPETIFGSSFSICAPGRAGAQRTLCHRCLR